MSSRLPLVFVDTNILLDAYRSRGEGGLHLLERLDKVHEHLIVTSQVEMEFKKNRQAVILESHKTMRPPEASLSPPAFLQQAQTVKVMKKNTSDTVKRLAALKGKLETVLAQPTTHDPVYKICQRMFSSQSALRLKGSGPQYNSIRRLAWRRFLLGQPPRKDSDTSIGDAINWEWIVNCVARTNRDVIIVTRDNDYGCSVAAKSFANDWLAQELKERTSIRRKLDLTPKLSDALNRLKVKVTKEEEQEEASVIAAPLPSFAPGTVWFGEGMTNYTDFLVQKYLQFASRLPERDPSSGPTDHRGEE